MGYFAEEPVHSPLGTHWQSAVAGFYCAKGGLVHGVIWGLFKGVWLGVVRVSLQKVPRAVAGLDLEGNVFPWGQKPGKHPLRRQKVGTVTAKQVPTYSTGLWCFSSLAGHI